MTTQEILAQAHAEAQRRGVPVVQVLADQLTKIHEAVRKSEILEIHEGCTPNGGCAIAAFRRDYSALKQSTEAT